MVVSAAVQGTLLEVAAMGYGTPDETVMKNSLDAVLA